MKRTTITSLILASFALAACGGGGGGGGNNTPSSPNTVIISDGNTAENTAGNPTENTGGKPAENTSGKPVENTSGNPTENTSGTPTENTSGNPTENTGGNPAENTAGNPAENTAGNPAENTAGNPAENTGGNPAENTGGNSTENTGGNPAENTGGDTPTPTKEGLTSTAKSLQKSGLSEPLPIDSTNITFETIAKSGGTYKNEKYTYDLKEGDLPSVTGERIIDIKTLKGEDNYPVFSYGYYAQLYKGQKEEAVGEGSNDIPRFDWLFTAQDQGYQVNETDKATISGTYKGTMYYALQNEGGNKELDPSVVKEGDITLAVKNGGVQRGFVRDKTDQAKELFDIKLDNSTVAVTPLESLKEQGFTSKGSLEGNFYNSKLTEKDAKYFGGTVKADNWDAVFGTTKESK